MQIKELQKRKLKWMTPKTDRRSKDSHKHSSWRALH